jgi:hypothetical protein
LRFRGWDLLVCNTLPQNSAAGTIEEQKRTALPVERKPRTSGFITQSHLTDSQVLAFGVEISYVDGLALRDV